MICLYLSYVTFDSGTDSRVLSVSEKSKMVAKRKRGQSEKTEASKMVRLEVESMSEAQLVRFLLPDTPANTRGLSLLETLRTTARQRLADNQQERLGRENKMYMMELLPNNPVILERIFSHLDPSDIKTAALVCRTWNNVLESPKYWTWATASLGRRNFRQIFYREGESEIRVKLIWAQYQY